MTKTAPETIAQLLEQVMRADRGRLISALTYRLRDMSLAEEMLQEAGISALTHWARSGLPASPQGWLLRVALRRAIDRIRSNSRQTRGAADLALLAEDEASDTTPEAISDERLRLIFTCCHPALEPKSQVALTLRILGGLSTTDIAAAFLDNDTAIGQRIVRAKAKIAAAGIPFAIPDAADWPARLGSVLTVVYLIFTTGYANGPVGGHDLCEEALFLVRLLNALRPEDPEIEGALALILITHARSPARASAVRIIDQDRSLWDRAMLAEGLPLIEIAMHRRNIGPFQIKAAIAACHVAADGPDWPQITALYATLLRFEDTPIVRLSLAVALGETQGAAAGLAAIAPLMDDLSNYAPFHAAHADFLARSGERAGANAAYLRAMALTRNPADAAFLAARCDMLHS